MSKVYYWKTTRNTIRLKRKKRRQHGPIYIKLLKFCKYHPVLIACLAIFLCEGGCYFQRCHGILGFCFNRCFSFCYTFGSCGIVMLSNNSGRHRESYTSTWESPQRRRQIGFVFWSQNCWEDQRVTLLFLVIMKLIIWLVLIWDSTLLM